MPDHVTEHHDAASALLIADGSRLAKPLTYGGFGRPHELGADRTSRISHGTVLVHGDLHNHTLLSDGLGEPDEAYAAMRDCGLDVAAVTDHVMVGDGKRLMAGLDSRGWRETVLAADRADEPGRFAALRGFEWTEPYLGHVNIWATSALTNVGSRGRMDPLWRWLSEHPEVGEEGPIAGFNHPGRENGSFADFAYAPAAHDRVVSFEIFNRYDDYLFEGWMQGRSSPLVNCLAAGWRPGLLGVTDEHDGTWGSPEGKGRAGLWVRELSRSGVVEAMRARRFFATKLPGLRLDATADGSRMGELLRLREPTVEVAVDLDAGPASAGRPVDVQLLRDGPVVPDVLAVEPATIGEVVRFRAAVGDAQWLVVRVADPERRNGMPGPGGHPGNASGLAYGSPWHLVR